MSTPISRPYTVTTDTKPDWTTHLVRRDGVVVYTMTNTYLGPPNHLADLLNDAYTKGVEAERARLGYETPEQTIARANTPEHRAAMVAWAASLSDSPNPPTVRPT